MIIEIPDWLVTEIKEAAAEYGDGVPETNEDIQDFIIDVISDRTATRA